MTKYGGYALVTGAGSGIGKGFAEVLAQQGYDLVLVDMNKKSVEAVAKEVKGRHSIKIHTVVQDLSKMDAADKLFEKVEKLNVDIGLLVNNAGAAYKESFEEIDEDFIGPYLHLMAVNYVLITHKFLPGMIKRGKGGLVYLSSIGSEVDFLTLYCASKAFVKHFATGLFLDLKSKGVDAIAVGPGFVRTNIFGGIKDEDPERYKEIMKISMTTPQAVAKETMDNIGEKPFFVSGLLRDKILYHMFRLGPWPVKRFVLKLYGARRSEQQ